MANQRVYQLAREYNIPSHDFIEILNKHNIPVKSHQNVLTDEQVASFKKSFRPTKAPERTSEQRTERKAVQQKEVKTQNQQGQNREKTASGSDRNRKGSGQRRNDGRERQNQGERQGQGDGRRSQGQGQRQGGSRQGGDSQGQRRRPQGQGQGQAAPRGDGRGQGQRQGQGQGRSAGSGEGARRGSGQGAQGQGNGQRRKKRTPSSEMAPAQQIPSKKNTRREKKKKEKNQRPEPQNIKLRDNSKKTKNKRVDYKKQREEKRADQRKNQIYEIPEVLTVGEFAEILGIGATEIIKSLMMNGTMATINQQIDFDTAEVVADDLGYQVTPVTTEDVMEKIFEEYDNVTTGNEVKRAPVVTVMGHVDHGKTSLLDRIRQTNVTSGEAGGITQHIGAYTVVLNNDRFENEKITFIDTPGHAAFTAMRSRGAQMTDIAVLVVAADDGVMPQTVEAINHAKAAGVPIVVAINKIDKEGANPERVKQELTEYELVAEEWGGDTIMVPVSAKKGENIGDLLENILLVAEIQELTADPSRQARGSVIEAEVKKGKGPTASLLIQQGTLHVGDMVLSGTTYGKIRTMINDKGKRIRSAGPSIPVEISGLSDVPEAGNDFIVLENEKDARQLAQQRLEALKFEQQKKTAVNLNDLSSMLKDGNISEVNLIVKADVNGSVEALSQSLLRLNTDEVRVNVIHGAVGAVNETDVMLASTSNAIIIGFNVRPDKNAVAAAEKEGVDIRLYRVIYDAINDVHDAMEGMLQPEFVEKTTGSAEVRDTFKIPGGKVIAGSYVTDGKIVRNDEVRVIRDGIVIFEGQIASLRRFKDDVKEVLAGYECGIGIDRFNDVKVGDIIETFEMEAVKREL